MVNTLKTKIFSLLLALFATGLGLAEARSLTDAEKQALTDTVTSYKEAILTSNAQRTVESMPPKLLRLIAERGGVSPQQAKESMIKSISTRMQSMKMLSANTDLENAKFGETENGTPYVIIPLVTISTSGAQKTTAKSSIFAMIEDGTWYLLDISAPQQRAVFNQLYPEFAKVDVPARTTTSIPNP